MEQVSARLEVLEKFLRRNFFEAAVVQIGAEIPTDQSVKLRHPWPPVTRRQNRARFPTTVTRRIYA